MKLLIALFLFTSSAHAYTRNFVPRANGEGEIGVSTVQWKAISVGSATVSGPTTMSGPLTLAGSSLTVTGASGGYGLLVSSNVSLAGAIYSANAKMGIGTASPLQPLDVVGKAMFGTKPANPANHTPASVLQLFSVNTTSPTLYIGAANSDVIGEYIRLGRADASVRYHSLTGVNSATAGNNYIALGLHNASGVETKTEVMRWVSSGNVGIGNVAPSTKLHLSSGTLTVDGSGAGITVPGMATSAGAGGLYVCIDNTGVMYMKSSCP